VTSLLMYNNTPVGLGACSHELRALTVGEPVQWLAPQRAWRRRGARLRPLVKVLGAVQVLLWALERAVQFACRLEPPRPAGAVAACPRPARPRIACIAEGCEGGASGATSPPAGGRAPDVRGTACPPVHGAPTPVGEAGCERSGACGVAVGANASGHADSAALEAHGAGAESTGRAAHAGHAGTAAEPGCAAAGAGAAEAAGAVPSAAAGGCARKSAAVRARGARRVRGKSACSSTPGETGAAPAGRGAARSSSGAGGAGAGGGPVPAPRAPPWFLDELPPAAVDPEAVLCIGLAPLRGGALFGAAASQAALWSHLWSEHV